MLRSDRHFTHYLKPAAFASVSEIKEDSKRSPYSGKTKSIETYPHKGSDAEKKPFQDQFNLLLDKFNEWGAEHKLNTPETVEEIAKIRRDIFDDSYSGNQGSIYFETIKKNLEKIFLALENDKIPFTRALSKPRSIADFSRPPWRLAISTTASLV